MTFIPQSIRSLQAGYTLEKFRKDLIAGITVGIIALPLAMAFGIASGVPPERGLFTAIVAGFLISALGGSRSQIGGPTGAFVAIVYGVVMRSGYEGLAAATLLASIFLILMALLRLGAWIQFVPHPLVTGLTTGIALIIFSTQIPDFFGLQVHRVPSDFIDKWIAYGQAASTMQPATLGLSLGTLAFILAVRRFAPKMPWGVAAIVVATLFAQLAGLQVETIQSRFGEIPRSLPFPSLPSLNLSWSALPTLFQNAFAIAFLGAIESLLSCVIADGMTGSRHNSHAELMGQGIANFFSVLFGGIPATGAIARTAANVKSGGQTPFAGMIHALTLLAIIAALAPLVSKVPLGALAAVLIMVSWNMSELPHFIRLARGPYGDMSILLTAFFLTVLVDITYAITVGMVLASFLFMKRMSESAKTVSLTKFLQEPTEAPDPDAISTRTVPEQVEVYEIQGPFFFGAASQLKDLMHQMSIAPKVFILRMRKVPFIDASGARAIAEFCENCRKEGTTLLLSGIRGQTAKDMKSYGLDRVLGEGNVLPHIDAALERAGNLMK